MIIRRESVIIVDSTPYVNMRFYNEFADEYMGQLIFYTGTLYAENEEELNLINQLYSQAKAIGIQCNKDDQSVGTPRNNEGLISNIRVYATWQWIIDMFLEGGVDVLEDIVKTNAIKLVFEQTETLPERYI